MKFFTVSHKNKKAGLSLLLAMIGSTIALSIVVTIVAIVTQSVERSQNLERSTQVFFAIESGLEAGFFHHNARGQGVQFLALDNASFPVEQTISHSTTTLDSSWTLDGRADSTTLEGLVYENTPLQLRWFWDEATKVTDERTVTNYSPNFELTFDPLNTLSAFNFGSNDNEVLLNWMLTKTTTAGVSSLVPYAENPEDLCNPVSSSFFCNEGLFSRQLASASSFEGTLLPRTDSDTEFPLDNFISALGGNNFQLIITPLLKFEDSVSKEKIPGIPFEITNSSGSYKLPRPDYSVYTSVSAGDFSKSLNLLNIPEYTAVQAFSYVIFD